MFKSAALRLTVGYLTIIMALSIGCSVALYDVSSNELEATSKRPVDLYSNIFGPDSSTAVNQLRQQQLEKDRGHLKLNLLIFNLAVLAIGGGVSYFLARRTLRPIEEALEMQKRFAGDASHELRTPLTAMQTEIEVSLRDKQLTKEEAVVLLKSNLEEVGKLRDLSEGLLTLATTAGRERPNESVQLKDVVAQAVERASKTAMKQHIKIVDSSKKMGAIGDHQQILNLLSILLDNAIKYSPPGSQVSIESKQDSRRATINVIDQGQGISVGDLPRIFERFYRADTSRTKNQVDGYGLGLAIAKKIVDHHKGTISAKSTLGKGTTFTVSLPS